jgi:HD superfamily phosphohydrolase
LKQDPVDPRVERLGITTVTTLKSYVFTDKDQSCSSSVVPLGFGGSSVVYKAFQVLDPTRNITVPRAVKLFVVREDLLATDADTSFVAADANFLEEISNVAQLSHENLVQVVDAGVDSFPKTGGPKIQVPYLVTQLVTGCTLRDVIEGNQNATFARDRIAAHPEIAVELISQIGRALSYLHSRKYLHCDIAPKNIFIEDVDAQASLRAIVGDLGMSRCLSGDPKGRFLIAGTKSFSPPEIVEQFSKQISRESLMPWFPYWDLFGFAKTVTDLLACVSSLSHKPWLRAATEKALQTAARIREFKSASEVVAGIEYCLPIHRERGGVPELEPSAVGTRKRMMPIEALSLTKRIDSLIRHPAICRLQSVPQLTIVRTASPGGNHTRYEHSLGVMENVRRMLSTLLDEPSFLGILGKDSIETGLLAGALYNSSRFPFSNIIHELNKRLPPGQEKLFRAFDRVSLLNEIFGASFRSHSGQTLKEKVEADFPAVNIEKLKRILTSSAIAGIYEQDEAVLYALLNSSLDARVIDFVRRDSLHLGLSSGDFFDLDDLLPHLTILPAATRGSVPRVCLRTSGVSVAEQIILMRYWLYQRVYWNQPNRAYTAAVRRALLDLQEIPSFESDVRGVALHMDERETIGFLHSKAREAKLCSTVALLDLVLGNEKVLYKEVFERNLRQCEAEPAKQDRSQMEILISPTMSYTTMRRFEHDLSEWMTNGLNPKPSPGAPLVLLDVPFEPGNIKLGTDIFVLMFNGSSGDTDAQGLTTLEKVSPVIAGVNTNFSNDLQRLRIFVRPDVKVNRDFGLKLYDRLLTLVSR